MKQNIHDSLNMNNNNQKIVQTHYTNRNMAERILDALKGFGVDVDNLKREDIVSFEELHIGGRETTRMLAEYADIQSGTALLDIGCGIGGPARTLVDEYGCSVTGVDFTDEFVKTAKVLTEKMRLSDNINFLRANGTDLPFEDSSFSTVWMQHLSMNIERKDLLFSEITRVLKPNGRLIFHEVIKGNIQDLYFPVLWATEPVGNHLVPITDYRKLIKSAGLKEVKLKDHTDLALIHFEKLKEKIKKAKVAKLNLSSLFNKDMPEKAKNVYLNLKEGKIKTIMAVFEKKA